MKMIVAVVKDELAATLTDRLAKKGFGATKLASTGGFLKAGNTTFLIGVPEGKLEEAMGTIKAVCPPPAGAASTGGEPAVSGATVFVLGVEKMVKV